jgi:hypothetical protein
MGLSTWNFNWGSGGWVSGDQNRGSKVLWIRRSNYFASFPEIKSWNNNSIFWNSRDQKNFSGGQKSK